MRVIADLHIHSRHSRATSERMNIEEISRFAEIKGLNLVGTGDFTHPKWLGELQDTLVDNSETSLLKPTKTRQTEVSFMLTSEVATIFKVADKTKKLHHVILTPHFDTAKQINDRLAKFGNLAADGRPTLSMNASSLVEEVMEVSSDNMVFPAHAWTPWFGVFGDSSGFNSMEECYEDMTKHICALETGLSSDPPMNWRLSRLDQYTLLSNSDSHSFWPWRIGREANVFEFKDLTYKEVIDTIRAKDPVRFKFTIETDPAYGKYHWTGHRDCKVLLSSKDAVKLSNICPVCRKPLTKGVEQRVDELADRPEDFQPANAISFQRLLPLSEIIATVLNTDSPSTKAVWELYNRLIGRFGNEYNVLLEAHFEDLSSVVDAAIVDAIISVREGKVKIIPGYDGIYGKLVLSDESKGGLDVRRVQQPNLANFMG